MRAKIHTTSPDDQRPARRRHGMRGYSAAIAAFLLLYVLSYACLSAMGRYRARPSGEHRYAGNGMAMMDRSLWCPAGMVWERRKDISGNYVVEADPLGWLFLPLISIDRCLVHPTASLLEAPVSKPLP